VTWGSCELLGCTSTPERLTRRALKIFFREENISFVDGSQWFHDLLFDQTIRYRSVAAACETGRGDLRRDVKTEHAEIVRAAVARDAHAAAATLERHYMATANQLVRGQGPIDRAIS
jgi:DNA-binding FadR family transcriptional regulator